jgi:hypothetical protein
VSAVSFFFFQFTFTSFKIIQLILPLTKFFFSVSSQTMGSSAPVCVCVFFLPQRSTTIARLLEVLPQQHWLLRPMFHWA